MIISNCPRCHEAFRVPSTGSIPDDGFGRCPWCHETFPIADVLSRLPPQLEILSADGEPWKFESAPKKVVAGLEPIESSRPFSTLSLAQASARDTATDFEVDDELVDIADEKTVHGSITDTIVDDDWQQGHMAEAPITIPGDPYTTLDGSAPSPLHSMNVSSKGSVRSRRKGSGIGTLVGIVLGGLASVPIAGLLLMMLGKTPDWGFWPFDGQSQGFSSIRAATPLSPAESDREETTSTDTPLRFNRESSPSTSTTDDPARSAAAQIASDSTGDDLTSSSQDSGISLVEAPTNDDGDDSVSAQSANSPSEETRVTVEEPNSTAMDLSTTGLSPASPPSTDQLKTVDRDESERLSDKAFQQLEAMLLYEGPEFERNRRLSVTYQTIASAASSLAPPGDSLKSLAAKIASSPIRDELKSAGWNWLHMPSRAVDGIALIGRTSVTDQGAFLTLEGADTIALEWHQPIPDQLEVLVLGVLPQQGKRLFVVHVEPIP
jgi:hypothetical protein